MNDETRRAAAPSVEPTIDEQVETIERVLQPRGRCRVCGGGEFYWKHISGGDGCHAFVPPASPEPTPGLREATDGLDGTISEVLRKYGGSMKGRGDHYLFDTLVRYRTALKEARAALAASPAPDQSHDTDGGFCWCQPEVQDVPPGGRIVIHRRSLDSPHREPASPEPTGLDAERRIAAALDTPEVADMFGGPLESGEITLLSRWIAARLAASIEGETE